MNPKKSIRFDIFVTFPPQIPHKNGSTFVAPQRHFHAHARGRVQFGRPTSALDIC